MNQIVPNRLTWIACCGIIVLQLSAAVGQSQTDHGPSPVTDSQPPAASGQIHTIVLSRDEYRDRVQAIWTAQMLGAMMGWPFEHKVASVEWIHTLNPKVDHAPVDDDWYYEMVAIRAFEKYGIDMSVQQLGQQWIDNAAGTWG